MTAQAWVLVGIKGGVVMAGSLVGHQNESEMRQEYPDAFYVPGPVKLGMPLTDEQWACRVSDLSVALNELTLRRKNDTPLFHPTRWYRVATTPLDCFGGLVSSQNALKYSSPDVYHQLRCLIETIVLQHDDLRDDLYFIPAKQGCAGVVVKEDNNGTTYWYTLNPLHTESFEEPEVLSIPNNINLFEIDLSHAPTEKKSEIFEGYDLILQAGGTAR